MTFALISTIQPSSGGVEAKTRWVVDELAALGISSVLAWYEPWSCSPELSVPLAQIGSGKRPGHRCLQVWPGVSGHAIGAWLPELEFTHYQPIRPWRQLIAAADLHIAITGNPLCGHRFLASGKPFLAWIGTPWHGDRVDRVKLFPWHRRLVDRWVNAPVLQSMERRVLRAPQGRLLTISHHTARELQIISGRPATAGVLYRPSDPALFYPAPSRRVPWRIGFSGRYSDPRKQIHLLLDAVALLVKQGHPVQLELTGEASGHFLQSAIAARQLTNHVHCHAYLEPAELAAVLQQWDLFVIPSHQEGLCIAALEAMACGVPVVSTRCGGPEDFVLPNRTGILVAAEAEAMAMAIKAVCGVPGLRRQLADGALRWIHNHADPATARRNLRSHLKAVYPKLEIADA